MPARLLIALLLASPAAATGVRRVQIQVSAPSAAGLFPAAGPAGEFSFNAHDGYSILPAGPLSLPPSAMGADPARAAAVGLRTDQAGLLYFSDRPQEAAEPALPAESPRAYNSLGVNAELGRTRLTGAEDDSKPYESKEDEAARLAGPLHQRLLAVRRQTEELRELAEKKHWDAADFEAARRKGSAWDGAANAPKADYLDPSTPAGDLDSVSPFTRALARYGMPDARIAMLLARYAQWHQGDSAEDYHNRLLGIRAANLMAQYLGNHERRAAEGWNVSPFEHEHPQALILAALLHRTSRRSPGEGPPTAREAASFLRSDPYAHQLVQGRPGTKPLYQAVLALIEATDYDPDPRRRRDLQDAVREHAGSTLYNYAYQRGYALRLGSLMQFITRAAMFTGTPEMAERAVRARADELRRGGARLTDDEATLAAAAELDQVVGGRMPFGDRDTHVSAGDLPRAANAALLRNYHHFKAKAARLLNGGTVHAVYRDVSP